MLGDEDHVGAAGDAAHHADPARVAPHHLDHHHAVVRFGGRVQAVDRLGRDPDGSVEAERVVRCRQVVVDRLRDADDREVVLGVESRGDAEGVFTSDRDERVEFFFPEVRENLVDAALDLVRVRPRRADDRAAAGEEPRDLAWPERLEQPLDEALPALAHADHGAAARHHLPADRPDDRIEARAVAAAGEDPDLHDAIVEDH